MTEIRFLRAPRLCRIIVEFVFVAIISNNYLLRFFACKHQNISCTMDTVFWERNWQCCGSGMFNPDPNFSIPDPGSKIFPDPRSRSASTSKNFLSILTQKIVSTLTEIWFGMFILDPDLDFLPIADPGIKKAPDLRSWSAKTGKKIIRNRHRKVHCFNAKRSKN